MQKQQNVTNWDNVPIVMDLPYVSRIVGVTVEALIKRIKQGTFPAYKEGKLWRVEKEALRQHILKNSVPRKEGDTKREMA